MIVRHPSLIVAVSTWDWKEQPNWSEIQEMLSQFQQETGNSIKIIEIQDTGCDENAIVICEKSVSEEEANQYYKQHLEWGNGIAPELLDWDYARGILESKLMACWDAPLANIYRKQCFSLLNRFVSYERSSELFSEIEQMAKGVCSTKYL